MAAETTELKRKVMILGESGIGKTCLGHRLTTGRYSKQNVNYGVDFSFHRVQTAKRLIKLQIWDAGGVEICRQLLLQYLTDMHAVVVMFDVGDMRSFNLAKKLVAELRSKTDAAVVFTLAGTKCDTPYCKGLSTEACAEYALSAGILYMETSAVTGTGVEELFSAVARALPAESEDAPDSKATTVAPSEKPSSCWP